MATIIPFLKDIVNNIGLFKINELKLMLNLLITQIHSCRIIMCLIYHTFSKIIIKLFSIFTYYFKYK